MQVVIRRQWGARHSDGFGPAPIPSEWWLHHSAGLMPDLEWIDADRDGVDDDEQRVMRALEQTGQDRFGGGISYTWLVPPSGRAYVGHSMGRQGAHTKNRNDRSRAICLIGHYSLHRPTGAQLDAVAEIMVAQWRVGRARTPVLNGGHRDLQPTHCPGDHAYALIPEINRRSATLRQPRSAHVEVEMAWAWTRTPVKAGHRPGDRPDGSWPAVEDTIALPGLSGGWRGQILCWPVPGFGGAWIQEAWWGPVGGPIVRPEAGLFVGQFEMPMWTAPVGARFLVVRYAAPAGGSIGIETEH